MKDIMSLIVSTWYIWLLIIIFGIIGIFKAQIKGFFGEKTVTFFLSRLDKVRYKVINNLMLEVEGKTSQIDHVVISNYGIFVIETKNYKGWILGDEYSDYWTQVIYKRKEKLYNPIKQNYGHVKALRECLKEYNNVPMHPIVVFTTKADLKIDVTSDVAYTVNLLRTIRKYQSECVSDDLRDKIFNYMTSTNIQSKGTLKKHVESIHDTKNATNEKISNNICPKCGGSLTLRKGKYGNFKGCSNYPNCKFTAS